MIANNWSCPIANTLPTCEDEKMCSYSIMWRACAQGFTLVNNTVQYNSHLVYTKVQDWHCSVAYYRFNKS